jgi:hypothetical protein
MEQTVNPRSLLKVRMPPNDTKVSLRSVVKTSLRRCLSATSPATGADGRWKAHEVIVNLIASTTTTKGFRVRAALDTWVPDRSQGRGCTMTALHLTPDEFHGDRNYTIAPVG